MINAIIAAIGIALKETFGEGCKIYTEHMEQGFERPCFFISCVNFEHKRFRGERYLQQNEFCIRYFPEDCARWREECDIAAGRMLSCLQWINAADTFVRGTKLRAKAVDGTLDFLVNYDLIVHGMPVSDPMEELSGNVSAKTEGR